MAALSVNINKIALLRNSRPGNYPDIIDYARQCIAFGAQGITVHPRPDQRHIRAQDCLALKHTIGDVELNIEGNPMAAYMASSREDVSDYPGFMEIIRKVRPQQATLVPDNNSQLTSDHGFDLRQPDNALQDIISELKDLGIRVSLFLDTDCQQVALARQIGADRIEFYTGPYAHADNKKSAFADYCKAAECALAEGLGINAGHDLNLDNLGLFATLPGLLEVSIGHALTVDALHLGLEQTIHCYLQLLQ